MKKDEQQMTYETPEVEAIEIRMEESFMGCSGDCGGVDSEEHCLTDTSCMEDFI